MKKSIWAAFVFMAAALVVLWAVYQEIDSQKENIAITEAVVFGDPDAAAGITLWTAIHLDKNLLWDIEYTIGSKEQAKSSFAFYPNGAAMIWDSGKQEYMSGDLYAGGFGSAEASPADNFAVDLFWLPLPEVTAAVASMTGAGQEATERIRLCDYYEYYPIEMSMRTPFSGEAYIASPADVRDYLQDLFRIPVEEDTIVELTVRKDQAGEIIGVNCHTAENPMAIEDVCAFGEKGCYYAYYYKNWETGEIVDRGQNNGIFYLPYAEDGQYSGYVAVDLTLMEKVCELPKDRALAQMTLDEGKGRLYLVTKGQEGYSLAIYSLDGVTPVLEQEISVLQAEEPPLWAQMTLEEDGLFLVWQDNSFSFVTEEDGQYQIWCNGIFPESEIMRQDQDVLQEADVVQQNDVFQSENALYFDGERLVLAAYEQRGIDVRLAVFGPEGMRYSGIYKNSMGEGYYGGAIMKQGVYGFWVFSRDGMALKPLGLRGMR